MKGIVVDKKGRYAVVLTGEGSFFKIHNKVDYKPGREIEFVKPYQVNSGLLAKVSSIAAVFLFTLGLSFGVYSYTMPYSYVDLDINPSIELTANIYDIIIKTETFNEDGKKLLLEHKLNFKTLDDGIAELVDSAIVKGYLKAQSENAVLLTITSKDEIKKGKLEKYMEKAAQKVLDKSKVVSDVISQETNAKKRDAAKNIGISPGKYTLIEKAWTSEPESNFGELLEDLKDVPV
ncbi:MAG: anti-sigma factor domain-containing protein [Ruminiclostridium sp.]|nr:anti-sigma factor domain-containing protein [Ruminiclostridium sp.]